jgi:hypothetical protein
VVVWLSVLVFSHKFWCFLVFESCEIVDSRRGIGYTVVRNEIQAQLIRNMCASLPHLRAIQLSNFSFDISDAFIFNIIHTIPNFSSFSCGNSRLLTACMIKDWVQYQMEFSPDAGIKKMTVDELRNLKSTDQSDVLERKSCRALYLEKFIQYKDLGYLTLLLRYKISFEAVTTRFDEDDFMSPVVHKLFVCLSWCKETVPVHWEEAKNFKKDLQNMITVDLELEQTPFPYTSSGV